MWLIIPKAATAPVHTLLKPSAITRVVDCSHRVGRGHPIVGARCGISSSGTFIDHRETGGARAPLRGLLTSSTQPSCVGISQRTYCS